MSRSSLSLLVGVCLIAGITLCLPGRPPAYAGDPAKDGESPEAKPGEKKEARIWYQLVKVTIPSDSARRKNKDLNNPPRLFVIFKKNGEQIGPRSTWQEGWSAVFTKEVDNQWPVREGTDDLYTVEVWDWNRLSSSKMIFNIAALKGEAFHKTMYEEGGELDDKSRLASVEWKQIETPDKYKGESPASSRVATAKADK